jgi:hypothetical protein
MTRYRVNKAAMTKARDLIVAGDYDASTEWSDAAPSTSQQNEYIDQYGYDAYGEWHLAIAADASEETKGRYGFPFGDFSKVNRAALIHAKQRAAQNDHDNVADAADKLLQHLDDRQS